MSSRSVVGTWFARCGPWRGAAAGLVLVLAWAFPVQAQTGALMGRVVDAAVYLAGADEGLLRLLDEASGDLVLRVERGTGQDSGPPSRLKAGDSLAGQALQTG